MKNHLKIMLCAVLLAGCASAEEEQTPAAPEAPAESGVVRLALHTDGHIFNIIAEEQGYLKDEGITVEYVPVDNDNEVFECIRNGTIDIASNFGTNLPLQHISEGMDMTIFAGYMLTGCMPVFGRTDAEWHGIEDLIGKTMACEPNLFAVTGPLLDMGYDPLKDINWLETYTQKERIEAVESGRADFGLVGTSLNYEINSNPNVKVLTYASDILPDYSCCRAEALTSWINENPNTLRKLLKAWIRAMAWYDSHHEETVALTARVISNDEAYVRAYLDNPRCDLNVDPMKSSVIRAWNYMEDLGLLDEAASEIDINDHINVDIYKAALDECQAQYGSENPGFYEKMQAIYARNNG